MTKFNPRRTRKYASMLKGVSGISDLDLPGNKNFSLILLAVPVLLILWVYFGKQPAFTRFFPSLASSDNLDFYAALYEYSCAFVAMLIVPVLLLKTVLKARISSYGLRLGDIRKGMKAVLLLAPVLVLVAYFAAKGADMQAEYPLSKSAAEKWQFFLIIEIFYLIYYIGWEFFFRGFMLNGLKEMAGALPALLIQTIPSTIVHIGKPFGETFGAIIGGLLFGMIALRTRSIWYPVILHALLGISTDLFVLLHVQ